MKTDNGTAAMLLLGTLLCGSILLLSLQVFSLSYALTAHCATPDTLINTDGNTPHPPRCHTIKAFGGTFASCAAGRVGARPSVAVDRGWLASPATIPGLRLYLEEICYVNAYLPTNLPMK